MLKTYLTQYPLLFIVILAPPILFPTINSWLTAMAWGGIILVWLSRQFIYKCTFQTTPVDLSIFILCAILPLAMWISVDKTASSIALHRILWGIVLFYSLINTVQTWQSLRQVLWVVALGGGGVALIGLVATDWQEAKLTFLTPIYAHLPTLSAISGPLAGGADEARGFFHPNIIAITLSLIFPLVLGLTATLDIPWQKRGLSLMLLWIGGVLFLTQSRLAIGALLLVSGGYIALQSVKRIPTIFAGLLILLTVAMFWRRNFIINLITTNFFGTGTGSWQARQDVWQNALRALTDFPFTGVGLALFEPVSRVLYPYHVAPPDWNFGHAHNNFLQVGLDFGLIGLVAYIALLLGLGWLGWQAWYQVQKPEKFLVSGVLASFAVYLSFGLFDALPFWVKPGFLPWFIFGLVVVVWYLTNPKLQKIRSQ